jgi:hypothetical protein
MVIHALRHAPAGERRKLIAFLALPRCERSPDRVARVRALMIRTGALEHARIVARALAGAALFEFDTYFAGFADSRDLRFMRGLVTWVMERSH